MKKQILFLAFFTLAIIFVGTKSAFTQNVEVNYLDGVATYCPTATPLDCGDAIDALHPSPGVEYTYTIASTDNAASGNETVHWFVVDNATLGANGLIAANGDMSHLTSTIIDQADGTRFLLSAESGVYNTPGQTSDVIKLTWNYFDPTTVVLLVAYVEDAVTCTNNIEAYRIFPQFKFTLDIAGLDDLGTTGGPAVAECVSPIWTATYAAGGTNPGDGTITVDYGENWVFFAVNAANWVDSWMPDALATFANHTGTPGTIQWAYPDEANDGAAANWHNINDPADPVLASHYGAGLTAVGTAGECIVLRVLVDHGNDNEVDVADGAVTVTMAVEGTMHDAISDNYTNGDLADLTDTSTGNPCTQVDLDDTVDYTLTPRPGVLPTSPSPFEGKSGD